jgi:hypothetical protein
MADDINPALRADLEAAKAVLEPQIRGLHDLINTSISGDLKAQIAVQIEIRERRRDKIQTVLNDLDGAVEDMEILERDGYPDIGEAHLPDFLLTELSGEESDLDAALKLFKLEPAQNISIVLGAPVPKPSQEKK